jgi:hypothetical protein
MDPKDWDRGRLRVSTCSRYHNASDPSLGPSRVTWSHAVRKARPEAKAQPVPGRQLQLQHQPHHEGSPKPASWGGAGHGRPGRGPRAPPHLGRIRRWRASWGQRLPQIIE